MPQKRDGAHAAQVLKQLAWNVPCAFGHIWSNKKKHVCPPLYGAHFMLCDKAMEMDEIVLPLQFLLVVLGDAAITVQTNGATFALLIQC